MSTNFPNVKADGFVEITSEQLNSLRSNVLGLLKAATKDGTQEVTIISSEPIFFKSKGLLEPKHDLPVWDDDTFNYFLEHIAREQLKTVRSSGTNELNTKFFDTLIKENNYSKDFAVSLQGKTLRVHVVSIYNGTGVESKYKYCFTIRVVPNEIPKYKDLNLPEVFEKTTTLTNGLVLVTGHTGSGKSQPITTLTPTPNGWVKMGDLKVGDIVFDRLGKSSTVTGVFPQGKLPVFEVVFNDGRKVLCNDEHIWTTFTSKNNFIEKTVKEMLDMGLKRTPTIENSCKFFVPINGKVDYPKRDLPLDPYILGAMLGDGHFKERGFTISSEDDFIPNKIADILGSPELKKNDSNYSYQFRLNKPRVEKYATVKNFQTKDVLPTELVGILGNDKYIPEEYMISSIEQRYELVKGLLDTDGYISENGKISFSTNSKKLSEQFQELIRSFGYKASIYEDKRKENINYSVSVLCDNSDKKLLFSLPKKLERAISVENTPLRKREDRVGIVAINDLGYSEEQVCIMVDNDEHLYLTNDYIVTHNTTTIASLINSINENPAMRRSILTIEDPVEFVHKSSQAIILQRALGINTDSYTSATKDALRQNVDTVVVGELREKEAMDNAIRLAEMGKLVFATVHCNSPADAIDRIVDEFEGDLKESVRSRLAEVVVGIMHQNLEVTKNKKSGNEEQIPCASGFLIEKASHKSELRKDYSRKGIANIIKTKDWAFSYDKSYNELVEKGIINDTPENKNKLIPTK